MGSHQDPLMRYQVIDQVLREKGYADMMTLRKAVAERREPGYQDLDKAYPRRTFYEDIRALTGENETGRKLGYYAPIDQNSRREYFYTDPEYIFTSVPFKSQDRQVIEESMLMLEQLRTIPLFNQLAGTLKKLVEKIHEADPDSQLDYGNVMLEPRHFAGMQHFTPLLKAINNKQRLKVKYHSFHHEEAKEYTIEPLALREYRGRWYALVGDTKDRRILLALDRIRQLEETDEHFLIPKDFSVDDYFQYSYGISAPQEETPVEVVLKFDTLQSKYVLSQPLHHSQEIVEQTDEYLIVKINVYITIELIKDLRSFGKRAEILEPERLLEAYVDW